METLDKKEWLNQLFDLYHTLLTEKQVLYFKLYYHEDYSLQEISELHQVTRNAVFDHLKKAEDHLMDYEQKLGLLHHRKRRLELWDEYVKTKDAHLLDTLRKLDE